MSDLVKRLRAASDPKSSRDVLDFGGHWVLEDEAADEIERLQKIEAAAKNLVAVKGRHHSEQAYAKLVEALK